MSQHYLRCLFKQTKQNKEILSTCQCQDLTTQDQLGAVYCIGVLIFSFNFSDMVYEDANYYRQYLKLQCKVAEHLVVSWL